MHVRESLLNGDASVDEMLAMVREHMGMDISFVSEFTGGRRMFRYVDVAPTVDAGPIEVGAGDPLEDTYCQRIVDGTLDAIICDARQDPVATTIPGTHEFGIGAHLGAPIVFSDGTVYGTLCAFRSEADPSLTDRDLGFMRLIGSLISRRLQSDLSVNAGRNAIVARITDVLERGQPSMVYQPIVSLTDGEMVGVESLARFHAEVRLSADAWFSEARSVGLGAALELAAVERALVAVDRVPSWVYVAINLGPAVLAGTGLESMLAPHDPAKVVLELTEHEIVLDMPSVKAALARLRRQGFRLAIDDVGSGYSGLTQILDLAPDIVKLDRALITGVDADPARRALVTAAVQMTRSLDATLVAEGLETQAEVDAVQELGVRVGQGYYLGRPGPLPTYAPPQPLRPQTDLQDSA